MIGIVVCRYCTYSLEKIYSIAISKSKHLPFFKTVPVQCAWLHIPCFTKRECLALKLAAITSIFRQIWLAIQFRLGANMTYKSVVCLELAKRIYFMYRSNTYATWWRTLFQANNITSNLRDYLRLGRKTSITKWNNQSLQLKELCIQ